MYDELMKRINLLIPTQLFTRLRAHQEASGASVSEIIRRAIDEFLTKQ